MRVHTRTSILTTVVLAALASSVILGSSAYASGPEDPTSVTSYAPANTVDVARSATATASSSEGQWPPSKLVDGDAGTSGLNLWVAGDTGVATGGWAQLELAAPAVVQRVVVFPRGDAGFYGVYFPTQYSVSLLDAAGAVIAHQDITHADVPGATVSKPDVIDFTEGAAASRVRIDVTKRQSREGGILQLSEVAAFAEGSGGGTSPGGGGTGTGTDPLADYQPAGTRDLALGARVSGSSSYEQPGETWSAAFAVNGTVGNADGWSTDPYAKVGDPATEATLTVDLRCASDLARVVVFPRSKDFPRDYRIETSDDGTTWGTVGESLGNPSAQTTPQSFDTPAGTSARYVRMHVITRNGPDGGDGYLVQLSEFAVFGVAGQCVTQVKPALELQPGATDDTWFEATGTSGTYTVSSSDPAVASVAPDGAITGVAAGTATIVLATGATRLTVPVSVADHIERIGDGFEITAFWPPTIGHVVDEQYRNLADAGIDVVQNAQIETAAPEQNLKMAALAAKYGMKVVVQDNTVSPGTMTAAEATAWAQRYTDVPGVGGFFLVDEPSNATAYATAFNAIRTAAPDYYVHLNFLPYGALGGVDSSRAAMQGWLDATGQRTGDEPDYLMYDLYPFGASSTDFTSLFTGLDAGREIGLQNRIKTATYLQAIGIPGALRRPDAEEIRYEANMALAYGYKQLSYFAWWTPTNRSEQFTDGIIDPNGVKTDLYGPVQQLNSEIHALGPTLMRLDAKEVFLSGNAYGQPTVPAGYFVQPRSAGDLVVSHLVDRSTGTDYLFVVNNELGAGQDVVLDVGDGVTAVREVSRADGSLGDPVDLTATSASSQLLRTTPPSRAAVAAVAGSHLTRHLDPSEGVLYQLVRGASTGTGTGPGDGGPSAPGTATGSTGTSTAATGGRLATSGSDLSWGSVALSAIMLMSGLLLVSARRRRRRRAL
ncbi:discoidin domain-containing protein [Pseudolysinimonas sp.]|uniref:discoidin domain-containing protein n=1 Tax=Pseudolysinimonas sp. TaxID=2680009 RepID=UPI003F7F5B08